MEPRGTVRKSNAPGTWETTREGRHSGFHAQQKPSQMRAGERLPSARCSREGGRGRGTPHAPHHPPPPTLSLLPPDNHCLLYSLLLLSKRHTLKRVLSILYILVKILLCSSEPLARGCPPYKPDKYRRSSLFMDSVFMSSSTH